MRIYKNDIIKASAISTGADRGVLLCSITDSGFTSIAGVISAVKDKLLLKYGMMEETNMVDIIIAEEKYEIQRSVAPYDISCNVRR